MDNKHKSINILLVDDDTTNLSSIKEYLEDIHGYSVTGLTNGDEALQLIKNRPNDYSVLLIDWTIKPVSGQDLLETTKNIAPDIPVIIFTGNEEAGATAYQKGAHTYFRKPVDPEELVQAIVEAVSQNASTSNQALELINISSLLIEQQTLDDLAKAIIKKAVDILGASSGCIYLWKWSEKNFLSLAQTGSKGFIEKPSSLKRVLDLFKKDAKTILVYPDLNKNFPTFLKSNEINSQSLILLQRADLPLGLLILGKQTGEFTSDDQLALRSLQVMSEPLLERAKVRMHFQEVDQQNHIQEEDLKEELEEDLREKVVNGIFELLGKPAALWLSDRGYSQFKIQNSRGLRKQPKTNRVILSNDSNSLIITSVRNKKYESWASSTKSSEPLPSEFEFVGDLQINSVLAVPLLTFGGAPLGAITIFAEEEKAFKEYDIQLVQRFTTRLTSALENYQKQWQFDKLTELGELLAKSKEEGEAFDILANRILELLGAKNVVIYPYDFRRQVFYDISHIVKVGEIRVKKGVSDRPRMKGLASVIRYVGKIIVENTKGDINDIVVSDLEKVPEKGITKSFLYSVINQEKGFVNREKVGAFVGFSLRESDIDAEVGVMYVNFGTPRHFLNSEINFLELAIRQAASIVRNQRVLRRQEEVSIALGEIIDSIVGTVDPLSVILEKTATLFSADHGSISRLTDDGLHLEYKALWLDGNIKKEISGKKKLRSIQEGITGQVVREGTLFRTGNVEDVDSYVKWYEETKSEMAIPLRNAFGGIIGVLNLDSNLPNFFTKEQEKLFQSLAGAVSEAIQQADLINNFQALQMLLEGHNIEELLRNVLKNLNKMLGANTYTSINLFDQNFNDFYFFYAEGPDRSFIDDYLIVPPRKKGTGQYVLKTKEPLYFDNFDDIPKGIPILRQESIDSGIRSFAAIPLKYESDILGVLFIHKLRRGIKFTKDAKAILEAFASQTAQVIYNAQHLVKIDLYKEILDKTVSGTKDEILNLVVEKAANFMASEYAAVWMFEPETSDLVRQMHYIVPGEEGHLDLEFKRIKRNEPRINIKVFETERPVVVPDVSKVKNYKSVYKKALSEIAVPLRFGSTIIGTINTISQRLGAFSNINVAALQTFADVAAIAINNAKAYEQRLKDITALQEINAEVHKRGEELYHMNYRLERRNASFEALTEIAQQLTVNVRRGEKEILTIIHQQASRIMDTDNMYIALYEPDDDLVHFELAFLDGKSVDIAHEDGWAPRSGGHGRTEWIIKNKTPILTYTKVDAENWYNQPNTKEYIGQPFASWLGVPVMFGEDVMGVIATYHKTEEYKYDPDDLKILELMGRQAAIALQNARLIEELDRRVIELDAIRELGEDLSQGTLTIK